MLKPGNGWAELAEADQLLIDPSFQPPSRSAVWRVSASAHQPFVNHSGLPTSENIMKNATPQFGTVKISYG